MKPLLIGKVAQLAGVGVQTVRFYERRGLIEEPPRKDSGYRLYSEDVVSRLRFIKRAKYLGFSLKEIADLISLRLDPSSSCSDVKERAEGKIRDIEEKVKDLTRMKSALIELTDSCDDVAGSSRECPIFRSLDRESD